MTPPAPKASGTPWLARLLALVFFLLIGFALPQQAAAQDSLDVGSRTYAISNADPVDEGGTASFEISIEPPLPSNVGVGPTVSYTAVSATLEDLGSARPTGAISIPNGSASYTIEVPIENDDLAEGEETFMVTVTFGSVGSIQATGTINASDGGGSPATAPDLTVGSVTVSSASVVEGASFTINATVNNEGNAASAATTLTYYRSADATITTGDTSIGTDAVGALAASGSSPENISVSIATAGTYYVGACVPTVSGETNTNNNCSTGVQVTVAAAAVAPAITTQPTNQSVTVGDSATFTVVASGTPTPTYQWRRDGTAISGATSATYTISSAALTDAGSYTVVVTNTASAVTSTAATLTVTAAVEAAVSIGNRTVAEASGSVDFTVSLDRAATGDGDVELEVIYAPGPTNSVTLMGDQADLGTRTATVTIDEGETEATLTVPVIDDAIVEGNETFTVTLIMDSAPTGATATATGTITDADTAGVSLRSTAVAPASEGGTITFTVDLDNPVAEAFSLGWTASNGTAMVADDLGDQSGTVQIPANARTATFTIPVTRDDEAEGSETFTVALTGAPTGLATIAPGRVTVDRTSATGTINASTAPPPVPSATVSITADKTAAVENAADGGTATFKVNLTRSVIFDVMLTVAYAGGTSNPATPADDLGSDRPTTVTINRGTTEATLTVPINKDLIVEGDETFTVTLSEDKDNPLPNGVTIGNGVATGTIEDDDTALVTLSPADSTVAEDGAFTYTVKLSAEVDAAVNITWTATAEAGDTATVVEDLQQTTGTVTFRANSNADAEQTFSIAVTDDDADEDNETFTVTLTPAGTLPTGVTIGTDSSSTATITDDDDTPVVTATVSIDDESVAENVLGGTVTFTAELTTAVSSPVVLAVAVTAGTATLGVDLGAGLPTTVTIDQGRTSGTFTVPITDDNTVEGNETFTVTLSESDTADLPDGVTIRDGTATGTITENDTAEVTLTANTATANENGGTFSYTVNLSAAADEAVTVRWTATDGTAIVANDLQATTNTVTFAANDSTAQTFTISPTNDNEDEDNETFTVTLEVDTEGGNPLPTGVTIGTNNSSEATITDDDDTPVATATVSIDNQSVVENVSGGNATFTAELTTAVSSPVVLAVAVTAGTATLGVDLGTGLPTTVTIDANTTEGTFTVPITDDNIVEGNETFTVTLSESDTTDLPEGVTISDGIATGTITENDTAEVTLTANTATANENGGTFSYTVSLSAAADEAVTVRWTATDGTATVANDLQATTNTVTFAANTSTAQTFTISPTNDNEDEDNETFTVTLGPDTQGGSPLPTGVTIGANNTATGTIADDDDTPAATATVSIDDESVVEDVSGGNATFTATLSQAVGSPVVLAVEVTAGTATLGVDLGAGLPTTVTIDANATEATFTVPITDDNIVEGNETFTVTLSESDATDLPDGVTIRDGIAIGTITENDTAEVTLTPARATAAENGTFSYTVSLSAAADEPVTVRWTATDGTATVNSDLRATTGTVTFATGSRADRTFAIRPAADTDDEGDETFTVTLGPDTQGGNPLPAGVTIGAGNSSAATITDSDGTPPQVDARVSIADMTAAEDAGPIDFRVSLSRRVAGDVTLAVAYAAGSADPGTDLGRPLPTTVTIAEGETGATLRVPLRSDTDVEPDETFTVTLSESAAAPLPAGVVIPGGAAVATGTITDDDETPDVMVSIGNATADAGSGTIDFTVRLSGAAEMDVVLDAIVAVPPSGRSATAVVAEGVQSGRILRAVTIAAGATSATLSVPIVNDDIQTFTVTLVANAATPLPAGVVIAAAGGMATGRITVESALTDSRQAGAGTALRRHAGRFDRLTGTVARSRLDARATRRLSASENVGNGAAAAGGGLGETRWGVWIDGAWTGFDGNASGRQADVYGGVDYLGGAGDWLIGALIGYEAADLDVGEATYRSDYAQLGVYGGARLSEALLFDGAAAYGTATPDIAEGGVTASYDASRITVRGALTGDFGLGYGRVLVQPRLGLLYSREQLDAFEDSAGGVAEREDLKLGRLTAGPRLTWAFDGGQVAGGVRAQWDFLQLEDGVGRRISGAADIGIELNLTPNVTLGVQGDIDGIGISEDFGSFGGSVELDVRF